MKNKIFYFILGALIFGSIGVYAEYKYNSKDVSYKNTNVESAINDLYSKVPDIDLYSSPEELAAPIKTLGSATLAIPNNSYVLVLGSDYTMPSKIADGIGGNKLSSYVSYRSGFTEYLTTGTRFELPTFGHGEAMWLYLFPASKLLNPNLFSNMTDGTSMTINNAKVGEIYLISCGSGNSQVLPTATITGADILTDTDTASGGNSGLGARFYWVRATSTTISVTNNYNIVGISKFYAD